MMSRKETWFKRRKYTGWGITPNCWQGWLYISSLLASVFVVYGIGNWLGLQPKMQFMITAFMLTIIIADCLYIAMKIMKDEREAQHEAIAECNVTWYMSFVLTIGICYQAILSVLYGNLSVDPFIVVALFGGVIVKAVTNWYLSDK